MQKKSWFELKRSHKIRVSEESALAPYLTPPPAPSLAAPWNRATSLWLTCHSLRALDNGLLSSSDASTSFKKKGGLQRHGDDNQQQLLHYQEVHASLDLLFCNQMYFCFRLVFWALLTAHKNFKIAIENTSGHQTRHFSDPFNKLSGSLFDETRNIVTLC